MSSVEESLHFMALSLSVFGCIISSSLRLHVTCGKAHAAIGFIWSCRPSPHPTMKIALVSSMFVLQYLLVHPSTSKYFSIYIYIITFIFLLTSILLLFLLVDALIGVIQKDQKVMLCFVSFLGNRAVTGTVHMLRRRRKIHIIVLTHIALHRRSVALSTSSILFPALHVHLSRAKVSQKKARYFHDRPFLMMLCAADSIICHLHCMA